MNTLDPAIKPAESGQSSAPETFQSSGRRDALDSHDERQEITIPILEERLVLEKRRIETGKVRLHRTVQEYHEQLDEPLAVHTFDVERVVLNQVIEVAPEVRQEGETTIYSLVEEQLVLTKRLILKEEVRVTRRETQRRDTQVVTLHRDHVEVEHVSGVAPDDAPGTG